MTNPEVSELLWYRAQQSFQTNFQRLLSKLVIAVTIGEIAKALRARSESKP